MPELILLCEGAAAQRDGGTAPDAFDSAARSFRRSVPGTWLRRCFAAGRVVSDSADDAPIVRESPADRWLRARLGAPEHDTIEAYGSYALASDAPSPRWSLRPANVLVGFDHLRLADPDELELDAADANELAATAAPLFAEFGYRLHASAPDRWFFTANEQPLIDACAWTQAAGRSIEAYMPRGPDARRWRRLLTDVQMHWHDHPVNARRERNARPAVNMLWLDGRATGALASGLGSVVTANPATAGLALCARATVLDPADARSALAGCAAASPGRDLLLDLGQWRAARRAGDTHGWVRA
ncbi:MAG: hypothetical protein KJZ83_23950, partial [Burkholderiaceae bacterium]|nr:hypothetical protein [Burkholderiaceae bacterium]